MLQNLEGQKVPQVVFKTRQGHEWVDISSDELFDNRTVVVFSLPGAFTPTCSSSHVPRYNQLTPALKQQGVDEVVCISVNDAFVMNQWQHEQHADQITFIPDGNGDFTRGMGMLVAKDDLGFGERSWRYSMLVRDGIIEKMFIEPDLPGDPFEVSDAETMLLHVAPQASSTTYMLYPSVSILSAGQVTHTSVHSPAIRMFFFPVALTASRKAGSSHEFILVRSMGCCPGKTSINCGQI